MAVVAPKMSYTMGPTRAPPSTLHAITASHRVRPTPKPSSHSNLASPTESESSDLYDVGSESIR